MNNDVSTIFGNFITIKPIFLTIISIMVTCNSGMIIEYSKKKLINVNLLNIYDLIGLFNEQNKNRNRGNNKTKI